MVPRNSFVLNNVVYGADVEVKLERPLIPWLSWDIFFFFLSFCCFLPAYFVRECYTNPECFVATRGVRY